MKVKYTTDEHGKDILVSEDNVYQIMMEWEKDYMKECINKLNPSGDILEIGFGIGYSATQIQKFNIKSHTIIECNPDVIEKIKIWQKEQPRKVIIAQGRWQDILYTLPKFDCIFFDDYVSENKNEDFIRFSKFLFQVLTSHTSIGSQICLYATHNLQLNKIKCLSVENTEYSVKIPDNCKYAKGDKMFIPVLSKITECDDNLHELLVPQRTIDATPYVNFLLSKQTKPQKCFRFHALGLPHTITSPEYNACAYTMKVLKFCKMMTSRGHHVIHYGHSDSIVECTEHVTVTTNEDLKKAYGEYDWKKNFFKHNTGDHAHVTFNKNGLEEIKKRVKEGDFILPFWGRGHYPIIEGLSSYAVSIVEPGIGYYDSFCKYRIFESWAIANYTYGSQKINNPPWHHTVIPNYFDTNEFEFKKEKKDYFLYLGRISKCKGVDIAIHITNTLREKLVIAGQGDICKELSLKKLPENVEYFGYANVEQRKELLANAKGLFLISDYIEPFGGTSMEAMLSGTPVITSDWGVFTETVLHGITGYRCRTFEQFLWATKNIHLINSESCHQWAANNYSLEKISTMYEEYFLQLDNLWDKGWYAPNNRRVNLNWLYKQYPINCPMLLREEDAKTFTGKVDTEYINNINDNRPKIAIWSEKSWALGQIHAAIIRFMTDKYDFTYYDWHNKEDNTQLWINSEWRNYDIILGNTALNFLITEKGFMKKLPQELLNKMINICHCPLFNHSHYTEKVVYPNGPMFCGITMDIIKNFKKEYDIEAYLTPVGVDTTKFYKTRLITSIKKIGFLGKKDNIEPITKIKRPEVFQEICDKSFCEAVYIHDKSYTKCKDIYEDIDLLIYCSVFEGVATGICEAAACGIPVISTNVGNAKNLENIKIFETIDEAVEIINTFNGNTTLLTNYIDSLTKEVRENWNWKKLCDNYWKIVFDEKLRSNLTGILEKYQTDKNWNGYTPIYEKILHEIRFNEIKLLEVGIGALTGPSNMLFWKNIKSGYCPGASLKTWEEYLPNATIYGIDISKDVMISTDRIKTFVVDSTSVEDTQKFSDKVNTKFDIIIDDGLHTYDAQIKTLQNYFPLLSMNGTYIMEDIQEYYKEKMKTSVELTQIIKNNNFSYIDKFHNHTSAIIIITKHN